MKAVLFQHLSATKGHPVQAEEEEGKAEEEIEEEEGEEEEDSSKSRLQSFFPPSISEQIIDILLQEADDLKLSRRVTTRQRLLACTADG